MKAARIPTLDGFRALAVLPVIFFHFFSKWTPPLSTSNLYPYGNRYSAIPLFRYGYLGVECFFVISGFVISMTLASSKSPREFFVKRLARLWPAMCLCSALTFLTLTSVPHPPFATHASNFIPSLFFLDPVLIGRILGHQFDWMDGAYWSLFVEVRFYFWAALVFFLARRRFLSVFLALSTAILALSFAAEIQFPAVRNVIEILFFSTYLPWFTAGIAFFHLYEKPVGGGLAHVAIIESLAVLAVQVWLKRYTATPTDSSITIQVAAFVGIAAAFYVFIYRPQWLSPLAWWPVSTVGAASYSLYLLHQFIGVSLLRYLSESTGIPGEAAAVFVILLLVGTSILAYRYWEIPAKRLVLRLLLPPGAVTGSVFRERVVSASGNHGRLRPHDRTT